MLELLAEKRQALITRAVTKGLDPDAPMKPSGISWLGDIPAHWEVKRLKRCLSASDYGISASLDTEGKVAVLRMGNLVDGRLDFSDLKFISDMPVGLDLQERDLLFNRTNSLALVGKTALYHGDYSGQHKRSPFVLHGADRAEQIGILVTLVGGQARSGSLLRPDPCAAVLLAKPGLILEPDLNLRALGKTGYVSREREGEAFFRPI